MVNRYSWSSTPYFIVIAITMLAIVLILWASAFYYDSEDKVLEETSQSRFMKADTLEEFKVIMREEIQKTYAPISIEHLAFFDQADTSHIPEEDKVYARLADGTIIEVGYFDGNDSYQNSLIPLTEELEEEENVSEKN